MIASSRHIAFVAAVITAVLAGGCTVSAHRSAGADVAALTSKRLKTFRTMEEFDAYREQVHQAAKARRLRWAHQAPAHDQRILLAQNEALPCDPSITECIEPGEGIEEVMMTGSKVPRPTSITNNQESDVDEGDIVKLFGRFLIVLQDGRLFSASIGAAPGELRLVDRINVYDSADAETWYDELLIDGDRLVVTGFNYEEDATEIALISITDAGELNLEARHFLESEDYYSGENYASRLVRGKFVIYTPVDISSREPLAIPRTRSWTPAAGYSTWAPLFQITDVYQPIQQTLMPMLHVVSVCTIQPSQPFTCVSRGVVGPSGRELYVSSANIYLWLSSDWNEWAYGRRWPGKCRDDVNASALPALSAMVFQLPVESQAMFAVETIGTPSNQFAFDERDERLHSLLLKEPQGCYSYEESVVFGSIPLSRFGAVPGEFHADNYAALPAPSAGSLDNRYAETALIYASAQRYVADSGRVEMESADLIVVPLARPLAFETLRVPHGVERIELLGSHAIVAGVHGKEDLGISTVQLGRAPRVAHSVALPDLMETEGRSHAFNALVDGNGVGVFGLPTVYRSKREASDDWDIPADVQFFLTDHELALQPAGELAGQGSIDDDYACEVSCVDWYGSARPIFIEGRTFALTGSELIEGRLESGALVEIGRLRITDMPARQR